MEKNRKDGVLQLIVDLNTIDANVDHRLRIRPEIIHPKTIKCLSFRYFMFSTLGDHFRDLTVEHHSL